ncbi:hypothetical protein ABT369_09185 [Dactylosporangium sp. NPDC000244]|uniref:hypothetical protein n=1 Tax=Dactylosporangium sp. NPDC000244 TaxID=3154365 RepID=UPI00332953D5
MSSLVLPLGRMIGTFSDGADDPGHHHEIQLGGGIHELSDAELAGWAFAHELLARSALEDRLDHLGAGPAAPIVGGLLARGLLAEVAPDTAEAVAFARAHRVVPTMQGLGNSADEPGRYGIGLLGRELIQVTRPVYELWAWAHLDGDLWRACEAFAGHERAAGGTEPELCDPAHVLAGFLPSLHGLLDVQAVYLDTESGRP